MPLPAESGARLEIAHLQMNGPATRDARTNCWPCWTGRGNDGIDITCDTYPYTAGSTFIQSLLPAWAVDGGPDAILRRLAEPDTRSPDRDVSQRGQSGRHALQSCRRVFLRKRAV